MWVLVTQLASVLTGNSYLWKSCSWREPAAPRTRAPERKRSAPPHPPTPEKIDNMSQERRHNPGFLTGKLVSASRWMQNGPFSPYFHVRSPPSLRFTAPWRSPRNLVAAHLRAERSEDGRAFSVKRTSTALDTGEWDGEHVCKGLGRTGGGFVNGQKI